MLEVESTVLVFIDMQGNLARAMHDRESLFDNLKRLVKGVCVLGVPIIRTEQNPERLGPTLPEFAELMPEIRPINKMSFSCCSNSDFMKTLETLGRRQVLVCGVEAHICVYQTALDLLNRGYEVQVVADGVSSRTLENKRIGLARASAAGAGVTSAETVLFELLKTAEVPQFKDIARIVK